MWLGWNPGSVTLMPVLAWLPHNPATRQGSQVHSSLENLKPGRLTQTEESPSNSELLLISVLPQNSHVTLVSLHLALSLRWRQTGLLSGGTRPNEVIYEGELSQPLAPTGSQCKCEGQEREAPHSPASLTLLPAPGHNTTTMAKTEGQTHNLMEKWAKV